MPDTVEVLSGEARVRTLVLLQQVAAVDDEQLAGDIDRLAGGEKGDQVGHLFRGAGAAHR